MPTESFVLGKQAFNWDKDKNLSNIRKHGISFKEAARAFIDPSSITLDDYEHSSDEERLLLVGMGKSKLLTVCHCYRDGDIIRIISARKATESEKQIYGGAAW